MSQPSRFSGAAIPVPPANTSGTGPDPATGNLWNSQIAVEDTPYIYHSFAEAPMVPMLVTEDTGPYSKIAAAVNDQGHDPGGNLGIVAPSNEQSWNPAEDLRAQIPALVLALAIDPGSGSHSPSMVPLRDTDTIYGSIADIPTCPAIVTLGTAFGDLPIDWYGLQVETPVGVP